MRLTAFLSGWGKALLASLITGTVLTTLGISAQDLFPGAATQIDMVTDNIELAVNWLVIWAIPNIIVGAIIILPVWLILILFGPKNRG